MKYLVNRETKEHRIAGDDWADGPTYKVVEADADGWIARIKSDDCPLPDNTYCQIAMGEKKLEVSHVKSQKWAWDCVTSYRPILDKPEASTTIRRFENATDTTSAFQPDLITRIKSAHEAAQSIPDLLAELREALGPELLRMLVDAPQPVAETEPEPDMSDWRNWRAGDLVTIETEPCYDWWTLHKPYDVRRDADDELVVVADDGDEYPIDGERLMPGRLRFHSRP